MLAIIEDVLTALGAARSDADIVRALDRIAARFGCRSAWLADQAVRPPAAPHVLDTDPARRSWWRGDLADQLRPPPRELAAALARGGLIRCDAGRFGPGAEQFRAACAANDLLEVTLVPIGDGGELAGLAGYCGAPPLDPRQELALQLVSYAALAQRRAARRAAPQSRALTPREREVMQLSAAGLTSLEIAARLGVAARTVNQHVDNVADKLGTRNRAHTVAEIVRRGLL